MPRKARLPLAGVLLSGMTALGFLAPPVVTAADARSITWARAGDTQTLDPHAVDGGFAMSLNQQIYEPLLIRDAQGKTAPALAESWGLSSDPLVWEFRLRRGVTFHDGSPFTAEDVVFSIKRAKQPAAGVSGLLAAVDDVIAVDSHLVRIRTRGPTPLLAANLTHVLIMSKAWVEKNGVAQVFAESRRDRAHTFAHANGTGPFVLVSREIGNRTVMRRNDAYWSNAQSPVEITELIYRSLPNDTERVQALVSGEVDFIQDVPVNELPRLQANKALTVNTGPENTSVFLGLNVGPGSRSEVGTENRNPLADRRVREAISTAINRQAIQRGVLLGQAIPTGTVAPSSINGYPRQLDRFPPFDAARAKALLTEAGFAGGFQMKLDCPREGYTRSEAICRAVAAQLAQVGITIEPVVRSLPDHLALIRNQAVRPDAYLFGISVPTFDSEQILSALFHSRSGKAGQLNATQFGNAEVDRLIESLSGQIDFSTRTQSIAQVWRIVQEEMIYVPLHIQTVAYAMKADVNIAVDIEDQPKLKFARLRNTTQ